MILGFAYDQPKLGPSFGAGYECRFGKILSFRTGLMYNERGGRYSVPLQHNVLNAAFDQYFAMKSHYLSVPVLFGVASTGNVYGFGRFGAMVSYLLDANRDSPNTHSGTLVVTNQNSKETFHPFDLVGMMEGGIGGTLGDRVVIEGAMAMQIGMTNAVPVYGTTGVYVFNAVANTNENPGRAHLGVSMMLAVKYRLGREAKD